MAFKRREEPSIEDERQALRAQRAALEDLKRQLAERVEAVRQHELELHHILAEANAKPFEAPVPLLPLRAHAAADEDDTGEDALVAKRRADELDARERSVAEREARSHARATELEQRAQALAAATAVAPAAAQETGPERVTAVISPADASPAQAGALAAAEAEERLARIEARLGELREAEKMFLRTRDELAARSEAVAARERLVAQKERELDEREDGSPWAAAELSEVEARLRRLEQQQVAPAAEQTVGFSGGLRKLQQGAKKPPDPV